MTDQELQEIIQYFDSIRNQGRIWIEVEMPNTSKDAFDRKYQRITGFSVPLVFDVYPYYVWPPGTNKWGIELRLYFLSDASMPDIVQGIITANSRKGYDHFDFRINNNKIIWELFANGFHLGNN